MPRERLTEARVAEILAGDKNFTGKDFSGLAPEFLRAQRLGGSTLDEAGLRQLIGQGRRHFRNLTLVPDRDKAKISFDGLPLNKLDLRCSDLTAVDHNIPFSLSVSAEGIKCGGAKMTTALKDKLTLFGAAELSFLHVELAEASFGAEAAEQLAGPPPPPVAPLIAPPPLARSIAPAAPDLGAFTDDEEDSDDEAEDDAHQQAAGGAGEEAPVARRSASAARARGLFAVSVRVVPYVSHDSISQDPTGAKEITNAML